MFQIFGNYVIVTCSQLILLRLMEHGLDDVHSNIIMMVKESMTLLAYFIQKILKLFAPLIKVSFFMLSPSFISMTNLFLDDWSHQLLKSVMNEEIMEFAKILLIFVIFNCYWKVTAWFISLIFIFIELFLTNFYDFLPFLTFE